jgi:hypothetical protein
MRAQRGRLVGIVGPLACAVLASAANAADIDERAEAGRLIEAVVQDPDIATGLAVRSAPQFVAADEIKLWQVGLVSRHGQTDVGAHVWARPGRGFSVWAGTPRAYGRATMTVPQAAAVAERFLARWQPPLAPSQTQRLRALATVPDRDGLYQFRCERRTDGVLVAFHTCTVAVRAWDGRVAEAAVNYTPIAVALAPKLSPGEAVAIARRAAAAQYGQVGEGRVADRLAVSSRQQQRYLYACEVDLLAKVDGESVCEVRVDGHDGTVAKVVLPFRGSPVVKGDGPGPIRDTWPSWVPGAPGQARVVFQSTRDRPGRSPFDRQDPALFVIGPDGQGLRCLEPGRERGLRRVEAARDRVVAEWCGMAWVISLQDGREVQVAWDGREASDVSLSPDGRLVTFVATRHRYDDDVWVGEVDGGDTGTQRRVCRLDGTDSRPVFAPDGRWIYFAHRVTRGKVTTWELWRVRPDQWFDAGNPRPERVLGELPQVARLSMFPDGRRLLVAHAKGLAIADLAAGKLQPLAWPPLADPDDPQAPPLVVEEPSVSPTGDEVAFVARRAGAGGEDGWVSYVYACRLDGTGVRRLVPREDVVAPAYVFPATGKPAFEVPADCAPPTAMR